MIRTKPRISRDSDRWLGHNSNDTTRLYILEDEAEINMSHSPFDLLVELE